MILIRGLLITGLVETVYCIHIYTINAAQEPTKIVVANLEEEVRAMGAEDLYDCQVLTFKKIMIFFFNCWMVTLKNCIVSVDYFSSLPSLPRPGTRETFKTCLKSGDRMKASVMSN
tara:strand:- start:1934 stop:2281 length:348 start_codon:yes stop_codon:yes gene_type:complete